MRLSLPNIDASGDLPIGVHQASLTVVAAQFGAVSAHRSALVQRLARVYAAATSTGCLHRFVVFGSFVTAKPRPNDVDIFMLMNDNFDVASATGEVALVFDHLMADAHFGCSVFWIRRIAAIGGEQAAIENWQIKRDGSRRGIVEIVSD